MKESGKDSAGGLDLNSCHRLINYRSSLLVVVVVCRRLVVAVVVVLVQVVGEREGEEVGEAE